MLTSMESYLRRGQRILQRAMVLPWLRTLAVVLACSGGGFFLSAGSLLRHAMPLVLGFAAALPGWQAVAAGLGGALGYWVFWRAAGLQGVVWSAAGSLLGALSGGRSRDQPLMLPAAAGFLTALSGLVFQLLLQDRTAVGVYFLRIGLTFFSCLVFSRSLDRREPATDWVAGGIACLCLAQVSGIAWLDPGCLAAGCVTVAGSLPGAVLAGVGLDLAQTRPVSFTASLGLSWLMGLMPLERRWLRGVLPAAAYGTLSLVMGSGEWTALPGLLAGGMVGYLMPPRPQAPARRGKTGHAQVRLELGARVLDITQGLLLESAVPPIDREAILCQARQRACGGCSARKSCKETENLTVFHLENPWEVDCRKQGRLIPELCRGQERLRLLKADHHRRQEYRGALAQQYRFLGHFLRTLADELPQEKKQTRPCYRVEAALRAHSRERANGDRCLTFPGPDCRYYIALCDGMGTGLGAAQAGQTAGRFLKGMLTAGFPPAQALANLNSLLILGEAAGAVTVDLAELHLDTGYAALYKWGAAPSWVLRGGQAEKLGTATPPAGFGLDEACQTVEKLSLRRGEVLVLLSDGVDGEEMSRQAGLGSQGPPGELAARLLKAGCRNRTDDATVAVIRLCPVSLGLS